MSINPQTISHLLSLCPICEDIQYKILMLIIGQNGTPSFTAIKGKIDSMKMYYIKFQFQYASDQTLTYYSKDLSLFNYFNYLYPEYSRYADEEYDLQDEPYEEDNPFLPDFLYEMQIAYTLYHYAQEGINRIMNEYKEAKKIRLNKMIEEGRPYNI